MLFIWYTQEKAAAFIWDACMGSAGELEAHTTCRTLLLKEHLQQGRPKCGEAGAGAPPGAARLTVLSTRHVRPRLLLAPSVKQRGWTWSLGIPPALILQGHAAPPETCSKPRQEEPEFRLWIHSNNHILAYLEINTQEYIKERVLLQEKAATRSFL